MSKLRTVPSLTKALQNGRQVLRLRHSEQDRKKLGTLRAGNSGIMTEQGEFAGSCPHVAHLRQLGIEIEQHSDDKLIMFQMGIESENAVFQDLEAQLPEGQVLLREEDCPIEWYTSNGTRVTGRPDGVIYQKEKEVLVRDGGIDIEKMKLRPLYGIELKTVASFWTTRDVLLDREPKLSALIQAAHYSWQLGIPYKLSYKNYVNQVIPGFKWLQEAIPRQGEPGSEHISYSDKGYPKNINPFELVYELDADEHGYIWFRMETSDEHRESPWTKSIIKQQDIQRYYEFVSEIKVTGKLGRKVNTVGCTGKKKSYSQCDMYCPVHMKYGEYEGNYQLWLQRIREDIRAGTVLQIAGE